MKFRVQMTNCKKQKKTNWTTNSSKFYYRHGPTDGAAALLKMTHSNHFVHFLLSSSSTSYTLFTSWRWFNPRSQTWTEVLKCGLNKLSSFISQFLPITRKIPDLSSALLGVINRSSRDLTSAGSNPNRHWSFLGILKKEKANNGLLKPAKGYLPSSWEFFRSTHFLLA